MKKMTIEEFSKYYHKYKRLPFNIYCSPNQLNEKQIHRKYEKYLNTFDKLLNKKIDKNAQKDKEVKELCMQRANNQCEIWATLTEEEQRIIKNKLFGELKKLDPIHIISRRYKKTRWEPDNIIIGMRYFHSCIDQYIDPLTGKNMSKDDRNKWFERIVGKDRFKKLMEI